MGTRRRSTVNAAFVGAGAFVAGNRPPDLAEHPRFRTRPAQFPDPADAVTGRRPTTGCGQVDGARATCLCGNRTEAVDTVRRVRLERESLQRERGPRSERGDASDDTHGHFRW